jgi:hypothetical protein
MEAFPRYNRVPVSPEEAANKITSVADVIIFDWLGGALEGMDTPDKVLHMFKQGADAFATYCQTENYLGIMFQQLAQGLALNSKRHR